MNTCDYDHDTKHEIRRLPLSVEQSSAVLVCRKHYLEEMKARFEWITEDNRQFDIPTWESLEVYAEAIK